MKLIEFKTELITRWYEIAPFSEISICEDDRYGGLLKAKAMIERGSNINFENLMNVLDKEKKDKK